MKKIFGLLTFILIGLINFGYCEDYEGGWVGTLNLSAGQTYEVGKGNTNVMSMGDNLTFCMFSRDYRYGCDYQATYGNTTVAITSNNTQYIGCITNVTVSNTVGVSVHNDGNSTCSYGMYQFFPTDEFFTQYTSLQCQTEYNLMPISEYTSANCMVDFNLLPVSAVNQNYCVSNGLCPSSSCSGGVSSGTNWSALYVNQIQHQSAPRINIMIPEEFDWDYSVDSESFDLDVNGYNVDTEYMNGVINLQNYKPSSEDFTNVIGLLAPYMKIIVFCLFVFFVWAMIRKSFKSKL